ncbi:MAG: hypothetical protein WC692_02975 [Erythrobacter sp.]
MIDYFALALTHALIVIALLRVLVRPDLDREDPSVETPGPATGPSRRVARRVAGRARRGRKGDGDA